MKFSIKFLCAFLFAVFYCPLNATPLESSASNYYISVELDTNNSLPSIYAQKSDTQAKWFDDFPSKNNPKVYEFGGKLPWWDMTLDYRNRNIQGLHKGATSKRVKIGLFYAWVDGSIISGLNSNDKVEYSLNFHELALGKQLETTRFFVTPKLGVNLIDAKLTLSGAGNNEQQSGILPIPFIGFVLGGKITDQLKVELDTRYTKITSRDTAATFKETLIAVTYDVNKYLTVSTGSSDFLFQLDYSKSSTSTVFKVPQSSPFVRLALRF